MKISILLPYKENFSPNYPGAVSIFVKDTSNNSKFNQNIKIYGSTGFKKKLSKNYINLKLDKNLFQSKNKLFVKSFLKHEIKKNSEIIEIHNRPKYIKTIKKYTKAKIFLYFHNDPLSMSGSKNILERKEILKNSERIIFNSNWSKNRFLIGLSDYKIDNKIITIYQSASKTKVDFKKKKKLISFIGKLNTAKGYDIFGKAIIRILDKHKDWNALVIGDEPREKIVFKHNNLNILGFKSHRFILNTLKKVSIAVVCSRWQEPFGRTSLEACSRGCATIISNRGGLPETTKHPILINELNEKKLFNKIDFIIKNKKIRNKYQRKNYQDFKFTHQYISKMIDAIRSKIINKDSLNQFKLTENKKIKILHITNFNERYDGRLHFNTGRRINNGLIKLGHNVLALSDRDFINRSKKITDVYGTKSLNKKILSITKIFKPNLIIFGHADGVFKSTILNIKKINNSIKFAQWFLDPITKLGPDYLKNKLRVLHKSNLIDTTFITTHPDGIDFKIKNPYFLPNPCDESFETLKNYNNECENDIFFGMSHGVHRGILKPGKFDKREVFINKLVDKCNNIKFDIYGMNKNQPVWGADFIKVISNSKMGLNLSRGEPVKYYSSDRIAQLIGNGLLTFIDKRTKLDELISTKEAIFYNNLNDLANKIKIYLNNSKKRKAIAKNGKKAYFKKFNSTIVANYIVQKTMGYNSKTKFVWDK